jgi:hypothetical protein
LQHIYARITLDEPDKPQVIFDRLKSQPGFEDWQPPHQRPDQLILRVMLIAEDGGGRYIEATNAFVIAGSHSALRARLRNRIDVVLGRNPRHRPSRLAWEHLSIALAEAGISITEQELIDCPFEMELDSEVRAALMA